MKLWLKLPVPVVATPEIYQLLLEMVFTEVILLLKVTDELTHACVGPVIETKGFAITVKLTGFTIVSLQPVAPIIIS